MLGQFMRLGRYVRQATYGYLGISAGGAAFGTVMYSAGGVIDAVAQDNAASNAPDANDLESISQRFDNGLSTVAKSALKGAYVGGFLVTYPLTKAANLASQHLALNQTNEPAPEIVSDASNTRDNRP